jgi:membrane protein
MCAACDRHDYTRTQDVEPADSEHGQKTVAPASRRERTRQRAAAIRAEAQRLAERAQAERGRHRSVDAAFEMADRDGEVGGGIIAGALAYRLFIWLLPLALVAVAGLGIAADASSESPEDAAESLGLQGLVSSSIANAANSPNRWYALLIGIPVLVWATRSVLRVLIGAHRLVWTVERRAAPKPKLVPTLLLLGVFLCFAVVSAAASAVRAWSPGPGVVVTLAALVLYAGLWLLVSIRLPHRDAPWTALIPGVLVFGLGIELLHVVVAYVITPYALAKQGTYGALGAAAALLVSLYLVSRLIVVAADVNATLWDRRARPA